MLRISALFEAIPTAQQFRGRDGSLKDEWFVLSVASKNHDIWRNVSQKIRENWQDIAKESQLLSPMDIVFSWSRLLPRSDMSI